MIPLFINNIRHKKPLPVYGKGENVRDRLFVEDHARATDVIFHNGKIAEAYNIGGFNEWKNIDIIKVVIKTVDRLLGREEGATFSSPKTDIKKLTHSESEIIKSGIELEAGIPANEICNRLNILRPTLYQWKRKYFNPILKMV